METNKPDHNIKLIWDFKGPTAAATAEHYIQHLKTYVSDASLQHPIFDHQKLSDFHSIAFLVVTQEEMPRVRDDLKPHRGELFLEETH
ncbi:MAG: hypothetical protein AAGF77_10735 [Bacteroidota bacterium]